MSVVEVCLLNYSSVDLFVIRILNELWDFDIGIRESVKPDKEGMSFECVMLSQGI